MRLGYSRREISIARIAPALLMTVLTVVTPVHHPAARRPMNGARYSTPARAVLAKMPDAARIEATIKDPSLREAVVRGIQALKACANVNKDQRKSVKEATLAEFERSLKAVQTEAERSEYQVCAAERRSNGAECEKECESARKKLCGCKLNEFGSFMTNCVFG